MPKNDLGSLNFTNGTRSSAAGPQLIFVQSNNPSLSNYTLTTGTLAGIYNSYRNPRIGNYLLTAHQSNRMELWTGSSLSRVEPRKSYSPGTCPSDASCGSCSSVTRGYKGCCQCEINNPSQCYCNCWINSQCASCPP